MHSIDRFYIYIYICIYILWALLSHSIGKRVTLRCRIFFFVHSLFHKLTHDSIYYMEALNVNREVRNWLYLNICILYIIISTYSRLCVCVCVCGCKDFVVCCSKFFFLICYDENKKWLILISIEGQSNNYKQSIILYCILLLLLLHWPISNRTSNWLGVRERERERVSEEKWKWRLECLCANFMHICATVYLSVSLHPEDLSKWSEHEWMRKNMKVKVAEYCFVWFCLFDVIHIVVHIRSRWDFIVEKKYQSLSLSTIYIYTTFTGLNDIIDN